MEKEKYLAKLYEYLEKNQYAAIKEKTHYSDILKVVPLSNRDYFNENGRPTKYDYTKIYKSEEFVSFAISRKLRINFAEGDKTMAKFFIEAFKGADKSEKTGLLKNIEEYTRHLWASELSFVFNSISSNKKELISNIHAIPISTWEVTSVALDDLDSLLTSSGLDEKESHDFYLKFFKARKNQIKDSRTGPKVRDFLLKKYGYDEEKLSPYFEFFNYVKELFQEIDLDFNEPLPKTTITSRISCRKAAKLLCIDGHDEDKIKNVISSFVNAMREYKKIDHAYVDEIDKSKAVIEVRCYTNNSLTQEELNNDIKQYLLFYKSNPKILTNKQYVEKWLMKRDLDSQLSSDNKTTRKMKI
jgi:hypothetical protein